jgi:predicted PurR-regulated permease PerM
MNGAFSVIGATAAIFIAMNWGFSVTLFAGALTYLLASFHFAKLTYGVGPLSVTHLGQLPSVTFSFDLRPGVALSEAIAQVQQAMRELQVPVTLTGLNDALFAISNRIYLGQHKVASYHLPDLVEHGQQWLMAHGILRESKSFGQIVEQAPAAGGDVVGTALLTFWGLFGGILGVVSVVILTFYLLVDSEQVFAGIVRLFPRPRRLRVHVVSRQIATKVSAWLVGQLILAAVIGASSALWLGLLGIPYFYVLALIAAIGETIPIVGPILSAIPGVGIALGSSWKLALVVAGLYLLQQQLEANILVPKLMERQVGLTPVAIMIALLLGGALLGIPGAILAVPTAAILQVLFQELVADEA